MKKKIFIFDLDNTICKTTKSDYKNSKPIKKTINLINKLKKNQHEVIIYTARYMNSYKGNKEKIKKKYYKKTYNYLLKIGLTFDKLLMGKPKYDFFVDDKSFNPKTINLEKVFKKYLN
ncbi:HAD hydrolase family protein [Candidatus Pelagibacter sp.]|uniref:HAD hydrolase family protein n=1 Tax=Candidatus Pelagibacter sp. TaxID=2024849 RepID=UPI003F8569FE|tara:strand:- start:47 stop:400 length:354 start_codon:yes stop_codon:yes gene_type:complete